MPAVHAGLLTVDDAADYLAVSPGYVRRLVRERRITYVKVGKFIRFRPADLEAWLAAGRVEALRWP